MGKSVSFETITMSDGDSFKRGYQHGKQVKEKIKSLISRWSKIVETNSDKLLADSMKFWPYIKEYSNEISREMEGIAKGSGSKVEEIVMLNSLNPLSLYNKSYAIGCTSFGVTGDATIEGRTLLGQNDDLWAWESEYATIQRIECNDTLLMGFALVGCLPKIGINSHGIAICINALYDGIGRPGVPVSIITRGILQQKTIGGALYSVVRAKRSNSVNLLIGDKNGEMYDIECTVDDYEVHYGQDAIVHTNHFLAKRLVKKDLSLDGNVNSIIRYNRMKKLINRNFGSLDENSLKTILADHVNYPSSICRHIDPDFPPDKRFVTLASFIIKPQEGVLLVAEGNPCTVQFVEHRL